jgi:hypothetical protein
VNPVDDGPVDLSPALDELIDRYTAMLREFAVFARAVREEDPAADVEDDPRVEEFEWRLGLLGAELDAAFVAETGVEAPVGRSYQAGEEVADEDDDEDEDEDDLEELQLVFVVRGVDDALIGRLLEGGETLADEIEAHGYDLLEWTNLRTQPFRADDEDDDEDEDDEDDGLP